MNIVIKKILIILLSVISFFSCKTKVLVFEEKNGIVAIEAEHFFEQRMSDVRGWYVHSVTDSFDIKPDGDLNFSSIASGGSYIEILPDTRRTHDDQLIKGENFSNEPGMMAIVSYRVFFNNPGKYYVWVRAHSTGSEDNGVHVGINNDWPESGMRMQWCEGKHQWTWASKQRTKEAHCGVPGQIYLEVKHTGLHTISFSMREDGFEMDKFVLSKEYIEPQGMGPEERTKLISKIK